MRLLFILLAFAIMGWGYWALSGGSDFEPRRQTAAPQADPPAALLDEVTDVASTAAETAPPVPVPTPAPPEASRAIDLALAPSAPADAPAADAPPGDAAELLPDRPILAADALALLAPDTDPVPDDTSDGATVTAASSSGAVDLRRVTGNRVNVRMGPGTEHGVVAQVSAGDTTEVLGRDGGWVQVRTPDGSVGWMSARFLADAAG